MNWPQKLWTEEDGVLSFEWTILAVVVVLGIVGGLAAARDTIIDELGDMAQAVAGIDQSFSFSGIAGIIPGAEYEDILTTVTDCNRQQPFGLNGRDDFPN